MNTTAMTTLEPKFLGFWTRCIRETSHWSQEALAETARLNVRTIQRIEAGKSVNITTRRQLALGLGYENRDTFDDPEVIMNIHKCLEMCQDIQKKELEKQFPDHVRLPCSLGRLADSSDGVLLNADDGISHDAKAGSGIAV